MSTDAAVPKEHLQLAVVDPASAALTMPQEEFVEFYCQPIQDDTWIRHEELVKMENLTENENSESMKKEILQEYIGNRARNGEVPPPDPILQGMLMQEQFMEEYRLTDRREDGIKATSYRQNLVATFRRHHPKPAEDKPHFGEEDTDLDAESTPDVAPEQPAEEGEGETYPTEEPAAEEQAAEQPAEQPAAEGEGEMYPTEEPAAEQAAEQPAEEQAAEEPAAEAEGEMYPTEEPAAEQAAEEPAEEEAASAKSPKAGDAASRTEEAPNGEEVAAAIDSQADEL